MQNFSHTGILTLTRRMIKRIPPRRHVPAQFLVVPCENICNISRIRRETARRPRQFNIPPRLHRRPLENDVPKDPTLLWVTRVLTQLRVPRLHICSTRAPGAPFGLLASALNLQLMSDTHRCRFCLSPEDPTIDDLQQALYGRLLASHLPDPTRVNRNGITHCVGDEPRCMQTAGTRASSVGTSHETPQLIAHLSTSAHSFSLFFRLLRSLEQARACARQGRVSY